MKLVVVIKKEIIDQVRDRRTITAAILFPVIVVPFMLFITTFDAGIEQKKIKGDIVLSSELADIKNILSVNIPEIRLIEHGTEPVYLQDGTAELEITLLESTGNKRTIAVKYDPARRISLDAYRIIYPMLRNSFGDISTGNSGVELRSSVVRTETENRTLQNLSMLLPVLLMVFSASSTMSCAVDISAGEKERGTLEPLLSSSIRYSVLLAGKIAAVSIIGFFSIISLMVSLLLVSHIRPEITGGISLFQFCGTGNIVFLVLLSLFSVILFSSAGTAIGFYAKSVKEGTILVLPVIVLSSILSGGFINDDPMNLHRVFTLLPLLNISSVMRLVIFNAVDMYSFFTAIIMNILYTLIMIAVSIKLLKNERVIFRS